MFAWAGWKIIGGLFGSAFGFVTAQWKWIVALIVLVILLWGGYTIAKAFQERDSLLLARKQRMDEIAQDLTKSQIEAQSAQATLRIIQVDRARLEDLMRQTLVSQQEIRTEIKSQKEIFQKHNFNQLVQAKPGLIENRANIATQERFDELETVFN